MTLPATGNAADASRGEIERIERALNGYLRHRSDSVTVGVLDLNSGHRVLYRPRHLQLTASIVKVEILEALLGRHHTPLPAVRKAQARRMITESDNYDAQTLWEAIGRGAGDSRFGRRVGLKATEPAAGHGPGYAWGLTLTTPADQLRLLDLLAEPNRILSNRDRKYVGFLMGHVESDQRWGVCAGTSATAVVDLKNGWLPLNGQRGWQINSIGYVRATHHRYLIAVMTTKNPTMSYGVDTVQAVSRIVWQNTGAAGGPTGSP